MFAALVVPSFNNAADLRQDGVHTGAPAEFQCFLASQYFIVRAALVYMLMTLGTKSDQIVLRIAA